MKKYFIVIIDRQKVNLYAFGDNSFLLKHQEHLYDNNFGELLKTIKSFFANYKKSIKDFYLVIDDDCKYQRFYSDVIKNKSEIANFLSVKSEEYFSFYEKKINNEKYLYYVLSYSSLVVNKYLTLLKKIDFNCKAILPLDFLLIQNYKPGVYISENRDQLVLKIFDKKGNYYFKKFFSVEDYEKNREKVAIYLKREQIIQGLEDLVMTKDDFYFNDILQGFDNKYCESLIICKPRKIGRAIKKKYQFNTKQKVAFLFIGFIISLLLISFLVNAVRFTRIKSDIIRYQKELKQNVLQHQELKNIDNNSRYLNGLASNNNYLLRLIIDKARNNKIGLKNISQVYGKPVVLVGIDRYENRNQMLKELKSSKYVSSTNLVDAKYYKKYVEFKIIVTGKKQ